MIYFLLDTLIVGLGLLAFFFSLYDQYKDPIEFCSSKVVKFYIHYAVCSLFVVLFSIYYFTSGNIIHFSSGYLTNSLVVFAKCFILLVTAICLLLSYDFLKDEPKYFEYIFCVLFAIYGFFIFISGTNLIFVFLGLELQTMCFYVIFGTFCKNNITYEAALKYYFLNIFASAIIVFGISFVYGYCGTINYFEINLVITENLLNVDILNLYNLGIFFILAGVFFKLALVPFHY